MIRLIILFYYLRIQLQKKQHLRLQQLNEIADISTINVN
jgi:hypothetical protein